MSAAGARPSSSSGATGTTSADVGVSRGSRTPASCISCGSRTPAFGDLRALPVSEHALDVEVLGAIAGRSAIEGVLSGWDRAMAKPDGLAWLRDRVAHADEHAKDSPAAPSQVLPDDK